MRGLYHILVFTFLLITTLACVDDVKNISTRNGGFTDGSTTLFSKVPAEKSGIHFSNFVQESMEFNFINYPYMYTGGGIAVGDIDNDGLVDLYFTSNMGSNTLYKNKGSFQFEDITVASKTTDSLGFSTGVSMLDVNADGWLDIYVCKAGSLGNDEGRRNLLFVNQQNGTFSEEAKKWGLDDPGFTTQAYPLDYDKDGDLDLFLLNFRYDFRNNTKISGEIQRSIEEITSDQLYRNDGDHFTKVTGESGLYNKAWGLGAAIGDFNNDGWDDIYIANDFLEPDILYINQQDGTFSDEIKERFKHFSFNSMGADFADLDNDLFHDLIVVDMLAENYARSKENMASMSTENFMNMVAVGYHYAYMANMLQFNEGNGTFQETAQLSGIVKTDWSWAPLIQDFDNDGLKDIFISNGVAKDYTNQDFRNNLRQLSSQGVAMTLEDVQNMMPSEKLDNYIFRNLGNRSFEKSTEEWGLHDPSFSNGAAYADLDNDGDMDLIVNNVDHVASVYQNHANLNFVNVKVLGPKNNPMGIGTKIVVKNSSGSQLQEIRMARGFQSSVPEVVHFGLGHSSEVEEIQVVWPDGKISSVKNPTTNQLVRIDYRSATEGSFAWNPPPSKDRKKEVPANTLGISYTHQENDFNDYDLQLLLPQKQSTKGTGIAVGDLNGDGLDDFFVGNAKGAQATTYLQNPSGTFRVINSELWTKEAGYEDANALLLDTDGDGDLDLIVTSAGYELGEDSPMLQDRLYLNDGTGNFSKAENALPKMRTSSKAIAAADYDGDGDLDLFLGGNVVPGKYPLPPQSFLLRNDNGKFVDVTPENSDLSQPGMVSDATFTDYDGDGDPDLLLVGEWMAPTFFKNEGGRFSYDLNVRGLENTEGWWFSLETADFDGDGDPDYVLGNLGKNNKFQPKKEKPLFIYAKDFDNNGSFDVALSKINDGRQVPVRGKECSSEQNPFLLDKIKTYKEFAHLEMKDIYGEDKLKDAFKNTVYMFETAYLENKGNGKFEIHELPMATQLGPTLSLLSQDINQDGHVDFIGIGAIYDAEVETIRYDSNYGYVLLGDGKGNFSEAPEFEPFVDSDAKDIQKIVIGNKPHYMVVSNNSPIELFYNQP